MTRRGVVEPVHRPAAPARLPLLTFEEAPLAAKRWFGPSGSASALTRSLATAPDVLATMMPFLGQIMGAGSVDLATKELVILRVSALNGCRYCVAAHRVIAAEAGVAAEQIEAVCDVGGGQLATRDDDVLAWIDSVVLDAAAIDEHLLERMSRAWRDDQLVELTLLAGATTMLNQYCTAFAIPPPGIDS